MKQFIQKYDVSIVVMSLLAVGFAITYITIGTWEAVRGFAVEALILSLAFYVARRWLPWEDAPKERVKWPKLEVALALLAYGLLLLPIDRASGVLASSFFRPAIAFFVPAVIFLAGRYRRAAWGLRWPTRRELLVLLAVIAIVFGLSRGFDAILPPSEIAASPVVTSNFAFGILIATLVFAALPQELFFRVFLQTRLAAYLPGRWALFAQALMYSVMLEFAFLIGNSTAPASSPSFALAQALVLSNGILAGYFWRKTGSLPLLILLHLFAFSRFGL